MYTANLFTLNGISTLSAVPAMNPMARATYEMDAADRIFVSVNKYGREIASIQLSGFKNIGEAVAATAKRFASVGGLLTLRLRNPRCGWLAKRTIRVAGIPASA